MKLPRTLPLALAAALLIPANTVSVAQQQNPPSSDPFNEGAGGTPGSGAPERMQLKIIPLANSRAIELANLLVALFAHERATIQSDQRTNAIIVRAPEKALLEIETLVIGLDSQENRSDAALAADSAASGEGGEPQRAGKHQRRDNETAQLAAKYQKAPADQREELKSQLRRAVEAAFEARQQSQRAELAQLRERLARIEQSLAARERVKDKVIANRVSELLDPNLQWEPAAASASQATPAATQRFGGTAAEDPLSSDATAPSGDLQSLRRRWPSATLPGGNVILRSAEEFGRELGDADTSIQNNKLYRQGYLSQSKLIADQRRLKAIQDEYAAQLRLLELELQNAELTLGNAQSQLQRAEAPRQNGAGNITASDVDNHRLQANQAKVRMEQLKTLLDLYRAAGKTGQDAAGGTATLPVPPGPSEGVPGGESPPASRETLPRR